MLASIKCIKSRKVLLKYEFWTTLDEKKNISAPIGLRDRNLTTNFETLLPFPKDWIANEIVGLHNCL
jgi:hypothetical protein